MQRTTHDDDDARPSAKRRTRRRRFPIEVLAPDEVRALLDACSATPIGIRHRAMIAIMYRAGLRICEVLDLYPKDVDLFRRAIRVLNGKGGRSRTVGIDPGGITMLQQWIDVRTSLGLTGIHPLICTVRGNRLTEAYVRRLLPKLERQDGIAKRVHAHGLRHTHAAELRAEGIDIDIISKQLGHRTIATTARYLDHIAPFAVVDAMRERKW